MTEKRFTYVDYKDTVKDNVTGKEYHTWYEDNLLGLLNELSDENEQLKNSNEGKIQELESEISAYKELIRDLKRQISVRDNIIADVEKAICGD